MYLKKYFMNVSFFCIHPVHCTVSLAVLLLSDSTCCCFQNVANLLQTVKKPTNLAQTVESVSRPPRVHYWHDTHTSPYHCVQRRISSDWISTRPLSSSSSYRSGISPPTSDECTGRHLCTTGFLLVGDRKLRR